MKKWRLIMAAFVCGLALCPPVFSQNGYPGNGFPGGRIPNEAGQLSPASPPPPSVTVTNNQQLDRTRVATFKSYVATAATPPYRRVNGQIYNLTPLVNFLNWVADLPPTPETKQILDGATRPLPYWSMVYGKVGAVTVDNGVLLWKYETPEFSDTPKLVRLRGYPSEQSLVYGDVVIVFAMNESPYSYIDNLRVRSTVSSFNYGKVASAQDVEQFIAARAAAVQRKTNSNK